MKREKWLDVGECRHFTKKYLYSQQWHLPLSKQLPDQLCRDGIEQTELPAQIRQHYAEILHNACRRPETVNQAFGELKAWLERSSRFVQGDPHYKDDLIQETLIKLDKKLSKSPLKTPKAFWAYSLNTLRTVQIDLARKGNSDMRDARLTDSLEALQANNDGDVDFLEKWTQGEIRQRETEATVVEKEKRERLATFFQLCLSSKTQRQVLYLHFIGGLPTLEIANRLKLKPHNIRVEKSRALHSLRQLKDEQNRELLDILTEISKDAVGEIL